MTTTQQPGRRRLHWSTPLLFLVGTSGSAVCAAVVWPDAMTWGLGFWLGWWCYYVTIRIYEKTQ